MRTFLFFLMCVPVLTFGQVSENDLAVNLGSILSEFSARILQPDPELGQLDSQTDTLDYMTTVHAEAWAEFYKSIIDTRQDPEATQLVDLQASVENSSSDNIPSLGLPPCFANWHFTELELLADLAGAMVDGDAGGMAAIVAKSAINRARYKDCMGNY